MIPRVSLIVPVYNVAGYVGPCLRSILDQTMERFELIVVDDGSTDGSGEEARQVVGDDPRVEILTQANAGLSAARNAGMARAVAPYLGFVDSDDRIAPDYLEQLLQALEESGADWVSCGIRFAEDGRDPVAHSAIHDPQAWRLKPGPPQRHDLTDWREVVRHFPSAWNKLYRREIVGDLCFDAGMLYEDHAFYWRYAARTDHLLRLPEPLYLSTQGRAGQITRDGSDAVFQQFDVLDILETVSAQSDKTGRDEALAQIATRLTFERAETVRDAPRWARFLSRSQGWLEARGMAPDLSLAVPAWWAAALEDRVPVSVVIPSDGQREPLQRSLTSLAAQSCKLAEVLVVPDDDLSPQARAGIYAEAAAFARVSVLAGTRGLMQARLRGAEAARGEAVVLLDAGDTLPPRALAGWHNRLHRAGAQMGFAPMRMGKAQHAGLHDRNAIAPELLSSEAGFAPGPGEALALHAHPSAKIFDRDSLVQALRDLPEGALDTTHLLARICAQAVRIVRLREAVQIDTSDAGRRIWRATPPAEELRAGLDALQQDPGLTLSEGWQIRLWARLVWEKLNHADYGADEAGFEADVTRLSEGLPAPGPAGLDPYIGPRIRRLTGL